MAEPWQSAFQSGIPRVTSSQEAWMEAEEEEEEDYEEAEDAPIFSLSKSSVDVLMAAGPLHPWDPALTRQDIRRSSSTNTHAEHNSCTLQQLRTQQLDDSAKALRIPHGSHLGHSRGSPPLSEQRIASVERWSTCSTRSDCSTPDSVVWRGGAVQPPSLVQEAPSPKLASPVSPPPPPPFVSPVQTPPSSPPTSLPSPRILCGQHQQTPPPTLASPTPEVTPATAPMPPSPLSPFSPEPHRLPRMENECILTNHCCPSPPLPSHRSVNPGREVGVRTGSQQQTHLVEGAVEERRSVSGSAHSMVGGEDEHMLLTQPSDPHIEGQESPGQDKLPGPPGSSSPGFCVNRRWKSPLGSSLSDSGLTVYCRCHCAQSRLEILASPRPPRGKDYAGKKVEQGTPRSPVKSVDAAVQTASPPGSWWNLRRNMSYMSNSNIGSHSILGSPPGSRLNLRSSLGSNSNLVSPSSSMFFEESGEEDKAKDKGEKSDDSSLVWEVSTPPVLPMGRRRSCLKVHGDEKFKLKDELGRRSSMKQVQWDEEGMTWDVHGSTLDAEELSLAIQRHLKLRVGKDRQSPRPPKTKSKKKTATKVAGTALNQIRATKVPAPKQPAAAVATAVVEGEGEAKANVECQLEKGKESKKQEQVEDVCGKRKVEAKREKGNGKGEEEGIHEEKDTQEHKSSPRMSGHSLRKGLMWTLKKPWCAGSSTDFN
ncbi:unnamed protein product [Merluccius merluccius]